MRKVTPPDARLVPDNAKLVFKGIIHDIYQWEQEMFDGSYQTFEMLKRPDTVKVIAIRNDKIVVLHQQQPDEENYFYCMPGGRHDVETEDELQAAVREMREETGLIYKNWKLIEVRQPHGKVEQFVYTFLATELIEEEEQHLDVGEKIDVLYMTLEEIKALAGHPDAKYIPQHIFEKVESIEELIALPAYS